MQTSMPVGVFPVVDRNGEWCRATSEFRSPNYAELFLYGRYGFMSGKYSRTDQYWIAERCDPTEEQKRQWLEPRRPIDGGAYGGTT